jgi:hypothetical protein
MHLYVWYTGIIIQVYHLLKRYWSINDIREFLMVWKGSDYWTIKILELGSMIRRLWQDSNSVLPNHLPYSYRLRESALNITWTDWTGSRTPCWVVENFGEIMVHTSHLCGAEGIHTVTMRKSLAPPLAGRWHHPGNEMKFPSCEHSYSSRKLNSAVSSPTSYVDNINWFLWISMTCVRLHLFIVSMFDPHFRIKDFRGPRH